VSKWLVHLHDNALGLCKSHKSKRVATTALNLTDVQFKLIDMGFDCRSTQDALQTLRTEIAHADRTGLALVILLLERLPLVLHHLAWDFCCAVALVRIDWTRTYAALRPCCVWYAWGAVKKRKVHFRHAELLQVLFEYGQRVVETIPLRNGRVSSRAAPFNFGCDPNVAGSDPSLSSVCNSVGHTHLIGVHLITGRQHTP
jgi:hypothetical protein